jgi:hypothetical protein
MDGTDQITLAVCSSVNPISLPYSFMSHCDELATLLKRFVCWLVAWKAAALGHAFKMNRYRVLVIGTIAAPSPCNR